MTAFQRPWHPSHCAEANASTLGNNQSKGIMDWEEELQGFFLLAKGILQSEKLEGSSVVASFSISTFQAEPGLPADLPHHPFFPGLSVLPCFCSMCWAGAHSISSWLSFPHHSFLTYLCKKTFQTSSQTHLHHQLCPYLHIVTSGYQQQIYSPLPFWLTMFAAK